MNIRRMGCILAGGSLVAMSLMVNTAVATHDHPGDAGALKTHVEYVPNFRQTISSTQCTARGGTNSTHGLPLGLPSCNPPNFVPGTQAHEGNQATSSADITVIPGDTDPTNGNQADVKLVGMGTDVRQGSATGPDYDPNPSAADVTSVAKVRISDAYNTTGTQPCSSTTSCEATVQDLDFTVPTACAATADPTIGSTCSVDTTANAVLTDVTKENKQAVVQIFRIRVADAGANGVRGDTDDRDFVMQGIYIP
jgi:hypothetical protein